MDVLGGAESRERVVTWRWLVSGATGCEERRLGADVGGEDGWLSVS